MSPVETLRIVFLGSGPFAIPSLERLVELGARDPSIELLLTVSRPDRPAGRGRKPMPMPLRARATELGLEVVAPESVNDAATLEMLDALGAHLFIVADYGEFLRKPFRETPSIGAYNLHGSLLPSHRGAAPVAYAIRAGDTRSGVTFFRIERELDSGPIVSTIEVEIEPDETAGELEARLACAAADLLESSLPAFRDRSFTETAQDHAAATLAPKLLKSEGEIDWALPAERVRDHVRAMQPWPVAFSQLIRCGEPDSDLATGPERLRILRVTPLDERVDAPPGVVVDSDKRLVVATGAGALRLDRLQRAGKAPLNAVDLLRGFPIAPGARFASP